MQIFLFSLLSLLAGATLENEDEDSDSNSLTTLESLIVTRTNGHGGPSNRSRTILELYQKVSDKENKDQEILLNLIEKSKDSKDRKVERNFVTKKPTIKKPIHQKRQKNSKDIVIEIQKKRRKRKKLIDKIKEKRRPSHMQLYWEKRLERAPKNVLDDSLFRDEIKKTTPPPSRKGGSEMYKPTTTPSPPAPTLHHHNQRHHRLHRPHHQHQHRQYKYKHKHRQAHGDTNDITATETKTDQSTKNMYHRQHSRISNTNIVLYKHSHTPDDYAYDSLLDLPQAMLSLTVPSSVSPTTTTSPPQIPTTSIPTTTTTRPRPTRPRPTRHREDIKIKVVSRQKDKVSIKDQVFNEPSFYSPAPPVPNKIVDKHKTAENYRTQHRPSSPEMFPHFPHKQQNSAYHQIGPSLPLSSHHSHNSAQMTKNKIPTLPPPSPSPLPYPLPFVSRPQTPVKDTKSLYIPAPKLTVLNTRSQYPQKQHSIHLEPQQQHTEHNRGPPPTRLQYNPTVAPNLVSTTPQYSDHRHQSLRLGPGYQSSEHPLMPAPAVSPGTIKPFLIQTNYPGPTPALASANHLSPHHVTTPHQFQHFQQLPPLSSALSQNEVLSQMNHLPHTQPQTAHFRLFPAPAAKTPRILTDSTYFNDNGKSALEKQHPKADAKIVGTSSELNHFITTPLPRHGPGAGYGYTTTTSFVNVQFGGNADVNRAYPFSRTVEVTGTDNNVAHISTIAPVHHQFTNSNKQKWSEISKYHLQNQKPISPPNHSLLMPLDSHIKPTTVRPAILPPLTPIINRPSFTTIKTIKKSKDRGFVKPPSIRFDQEMFPEKVHPVALPPLVHNHNIINSPLFVSDVYEKKLNRRMSFPQDLENEEAVSSELRDNTELNGSQLWRGNYRHKPALEFIDDLSDHKPNKNIVSSHFWMSDPTKSMELKSIRFPNN